MPTQTQKLRALRDAYAQEAQALRQLREFPTERAQRQNYGQHRFLDDLVYALRFLDDADLKPKQIQAQTEIVLSSLADWKIDTLIGHIRERERNGLSELAEWMAEGVIMQIDRVFPGLQATFSPQWRQKSRIYGHYFQLYHHREQWSWSIEDGLACWQSAERAQRFEEVGILKLETTGEVVECLDVIARLSKSTTTSWTTNREVAWVCRATPPLRSLTMCDVIVPLFGPAWMVDRTGFRQIPGTGKETAHHAH